MAAACREQDWSSNQGGLNNPCMARGKFARVCVEIDTSKPLRSGYTLRAKHLPMQYEGLHTLCFHCG